MKKKRFLSLLAAVVLICGLVGCQAHIASDKVNAETKQIVNEATEIKTIEPPEDGWTIDELARVFRINNEPIELPFILNNLNEKYNIKKEETKILDSGACGTILYYNDVSFLVINYTDVQNFKQIYKKMLTV